MDLPAPLVPANENGFAVVRESGRVHAVAGAALQDFNQQNREHKMRGHEHVHGVRLHDGKGSRTQARIAQRSQPISEAKVELVRRFEIAGFARGQLIEASALFMWSFHPVPACVGHGLKIEGNCFRRLPAGGKKTKAAVERLGDGLRTQDAEIQSEETIVSCLLNFAHEPEISLVRLAPAGPDAGLLVREMRYISAYRVRGS